MDAVTLYSTWPDLPAAKAAARALVEQRLIACANIIPGAVSVFRWDGAIQEAAELVMLAKTSAAKAEAAASAIVALHPYDTPCVTALPIEARGASAAFLVWINAETN